MAALVRSASQGGDTTGASAICPPPAGVTDGDILRMSIYKENTAAITWPSGFSQFATINDGTRHLSCAWKRASGESGNYTASWTGSTFFVVGMEACSGCLASGNPTTDATPTTSNPGIENGGTTFAAITTTTDGDLVLVTVANAGTAGGNIWVASSGFSLQVNLDDLCTQSLTKTPAGIVASGKPTYSGVSGNALGLTMVLLPAATVVLSAGVMDYSRFPKSFLRQGGHL